MVRRGFAIRHSSLLRVWVATLIVLPWHGALGAETGVEATSIRLSADAEVGGVWIDGHAIELGKEARDWSRADEYGPRHGLRCLAVCAQSGSKMGHAGFIGSVILQDGPWVVTDSTWRAWTGEAEPTRDAKGRSWTDPGYDDSAWPFATELGPYGCGPWGNGEGAQAQEAGNFVSQSGKLPPAGNAPPPAGATEGSLDRAMREISAAPANTAPTAELPDDAILPAGTDISSFFKSVGGTRLWNANWIWAGPALGGATRAYFRKVFAGGAGIPPSQPQYLHLTSVNSTSFALAWQPSFSAQGPVVYEMNWNGQIMLKTTDTHGTLDGITINPVAQNYASVCAVAPDGTRSRPSSFVLIATASQDVPEAPTHLRVTERTPHGLTVAWDPAKDRGELGNYCVLFNHILCLVPPGVCSATINFAPGIDAGTPVRVDVSAEDCDGKMGPTASLDDWSSAENPVPFPFPTSLRLESGHLSWNAVPGATAYRVWRDGLAIPGRVTTTNAPLPKGEANGFVQVSAMDDAGNASPRSTPLVIGKPSGPQAPVVVDGGHSGDVIILRWTRAEAGTCRGYRVERQEGATWSTLAQIDDPWQNEFRVGRIEKYQTGSRDSLPQPPEISGASLQPGTAYSFRIVALGTDGTEVASGLRQVTTVAPPSADAKLHFAVIVATNGRYDFLDKSLTDAEAAHCAFALIKGQIVPQLNADPKQWDAMMAVVRRHSVRPILALLGSKDGWTEINDETSSGSALDDQPVLGRYDMAPWRTGQPLDQIHTELGGALRLAGFVENVRGNPDFLPDLQQWLQEAEGDRACRWFFTGGVSTESAPSGVPRVMLELSRPTIDFMRMINGDRGHELALDPGSAVACACPQRNRVGGHSLVTVEDKRLVLESRLYDPKTKSFVTDGLDEIAYDRADNRISAANLRVPYPFGIANGLPERADDPPPWTQNQILRCRRDGQVEVRPLGHTARGVPLSFTVSRPPAHGTLDGTGENLIYHPAPGFTGEDFFLCRADDGGPWPGNTGWVRITVAEKAPDK